MQELIKSLNTHLNPIQAQIILQALQNAHNEDFFNFVLKNLQKIINWLNCAEFKEKYLQPQHPYPPLLNPQFIDTDNSRYCAELAWNLNLPLPQKCLFIYISPHGVGAAAFLRFLNEACEVLCFPSWTQENSAKERYILNYRCLNDENIKYFAINISEINISDFDKYLSLMGDIPILYGTRDPISLLKHTYGRDWSKVKRAYNNEFCFNDDYSPYLEFLRHGGGAFEIKDLTQLSQRTFLAKYCLSKLHNNALHFCDMSEIKPEFAFSTLEKLSQLFHFKPPKAEKKELFKYTEFRAYLRYLLPLKMKATNSQNKDFIFIFHRAFEWQDYVNIIKDLSKSDLYLDLGVYIHKEDFFLLQQDKKFYENILHYCQKFCTALEQSCDEAERKMPKEDAVLAFLQKNTKIKKELEILLDEDLAYIKKLAPNIVASWKYYLEFLKL